MNKIYIFGAHSRGKTTAHYLCYLNPQISIEAYLYDNDEKNDLSIHGTPVIHIDDKTKLMPDYPVYIGTRGIFHPSIIKRLQKLGMKNICPVTLELDLQLRNAYVKKYYESMGRDFVKIDDFFATEIKSCIYVARSVHDKPLKEIYMLQDYEREIQVGAELTEIRLEDNILLDNIGENISIYNKQFCELTALYWIWKNATEDIIGLVHYRRHFTLPKDWKERMIQNQIDVILPLPLCVVPNLEEDFRNRHDGSDLDYLFTYLKKTNLVDYEGIKFFFQQGLYSPCNMLIVRKEVLNELCEWLFPILFAVVAHGGEKEDVYLNRYPGFISERLISYYFEKNRDYYKIVYADKNFLQ